MYVLLIILLIVIAVSLILRGATTNRRWMIVAGVATIAGTILLFTMLSFLAEMLWFESLGYGRRFWTEVLAKLALTVAGAVAGCVITYLLTWPIPKESDVTSIWPEAAGAFVGGVWGLSSWDVVLRFWNRVDAGVTEPILAKDVSFYLFSLPLYDRVYWLLLGLTAIALAAAVAYYLAPRAREEEAGNAVTQFDRDLLAARNHDWTGHRPLFVALGAGVFVLAWGRYLDAFHLLYSQWGVVTGPGWTDVTIRLPAYYIVAVVTALLGLDLMAPALSRKVYNWLRARRWGGGHFAIVAVAAPAALVAAIWLIGLGLVPAIVQLVFVEPNEITVEKPYIAHNIRFTRQAFRLDEVVEREFPASEQFTPEMVAANKYLLSEVRLWDPRALDAVYKQFQEIRLYYEFPDVDIDRYTIGGRYRQVMIATREMELANLPEQSQTFVNRRIKYTHGHGLTLATVSDFTADGLPVLLVKDIPPTSTHSELAVQRPQIYYGELSTEHVIVNTKEDEFDYPSGDRNVYCQYSGTGGIPIANLWRKFMFGWRFDGTRFLFSTYLTPNSRVMFHRQIRERVETLAPFLDFDEDPYMVLHEGKLFWIVDAYTTSSYYPYSTHFVSADAAKHLQRANYVRNSVKAVVDAYDGSVTFYIFEPQDPVIQVWAKIFPGLFQPREMMPAGLRAHVRYPEELLLAQGLVYAKYHMTDPAVFYNQEDLWVRATEKYYTQVQDVVPYYIMWKPPDAQQAEFVLILPFTPKSKQVMIGWIAGMCDGENYGRLLAYRFPKDKRVLGPQQIETKIDQDRFLSGQLTLWDQRGSQVIRGNLLTIPIDGTLLYVEPIYLRAEAAAYPELRLVALMHGDRLSYAETFDEALRGLIEPVSETPPIAPPASIAGQTMDDLIRRANEAFDNYLRLLGEKRFGEAAEQLKMLQEALQQMRQRTTAAETGKSEGANKTGGDGLR